MTMAPRDYNNLRLQFWNRIFQLNGAAFQSFCEEILKYSYPDFRKVDPFGSVGDGGADGYREIAGVYYQMYAPKSPQFKAKDAADKLEDDFALLKKSWDKIHTIKEYCFVFNDKGGGTIVTIEESLAILQNQYPEISFRSLISHDLEKLFFRLDPKQMLALGFDIDATRAISIAHSILDHVRLLLDRWCSKVAAKILVGVEETISSLADEDLSIEYDILNALAFYRQEMVEEAKEKYEKILDKYPNHVKTIVGLAQICLDCEDFDGHEDLLARVKAIAPDSMDLKLQRFLRSLRSDRFEEIPGLEESILPTEPRQKSDFLRMYAVKMAMTDDLQQAKALIERAILANPNQLQNHIAKLQIVLSSCAGETQEKPETKATNRASMFAELDSLEERIHEWDAMGPRILAIMNVARIGILLEDENVKGIEKLSQPTADHLLQCSFDRVIDQLLVDLLHFAAWPIKVLEALLKYLKANSHESPSSTLCNAIFAQLLFHEVLFTTGKQFFQEIESSRCLELIGSIEQKNYDKFCEMLGGDLQFAVDIALSAKSNPGLRWKVVESLPDSGTVQKKKLLLLLHAEEENTKEAFRLLKAMDLSSLGKMEADVVLRVAEQKKAWDFVALIQEKLLDSEEDDRISAHRKLHLVTALFMLEKYRDVVVIGEELLSDKTKVDHLGADDKERLLALTIQSRLNRAESAEAVKLLEIYAQFVKNPRFRFDVEVETYIATNMPDKAIGCLVNGLRQIGSPSPEQFAQLFYATVRIGNLSMLELPVRSEIIPESFVKFKEQERWYFVGSLGALDATLISTDDSRYAAYLGKRVGDVFSTNDRYSSQKHEITIEAILSSEGYVLLRASHCAQRLTKEGRWDSMKAVEVPHTGGTLDLRFLTAFMEDEHQKSREAFDLFCQGQVPFALLALSQGGLIGAVGLICNEERDSY